MNVNIFEFFAGIGGMGLAFSQAFPDLLGLGRHVLVESDPEAREVLKLRFPGAEVREDVRDSCKGEGANWVLAGFPCQGFSRGNQNQKHFNDARSSLFFDLMERIKELSPDAIFLENVPNILRHLPTVEKALGDLGYNLEWRLLYAFHHGADISRRRWFGLAHREPFEVLEFPTHEKKPVPLWPAPWASGFMEQQAGVFLRRAAHVHQSTGQTCGVPLSVALQMGEGWRAEYREILKGGKVRDFPRAFINADWLDTLMGYPAGWTDTTGATPDPSRRLVSHRGHRSRYRMLGNTVVPSQAKAFLDSINF